MKLYVDKFEKMGKCTDKTVFTGMEQNESEIGLEENNQGFYSLQAKLLNMKWRCQVSN